MRESLGELVARLGLELTSADESPRDQTLARISVESDSDVVRVDVHFSTGTGPAHYRVPRTQGELLSETLAHVILGAIEPLLPPLEVSVDPPAVPSPPPVPRAAPARAAPEPSPPPPLDTAGGSPLVREWFVGALGRPSVIGSGKWQTVLGATLGAALDVPGRPSLALDLTGSIPARVGDDVRAALSRWGARVRLRFEPASADSLALQLGLGAGVDGIWMTPRVADPFAPRSGPGGSARVQPVVGAFIGGSARLGSNLRLLAALGVDLEIHPRRWWVDFGPVRSEVFETPRWQPLAMVGLEWDLVSGSPSRSFPVGAGEAAAAARSEGGAE